MHKGGLRSGSVIRVTEFNKITGFCWFLFGIASESNSDPVPADLPWLIHRGECARSLTLGDFCFVNNLFRQGSRYGDGGTRM